MLNRYQRAAQTLIDEKKQIPLLLIVNRKGDPASWDDHYWKINNLEGASLNIPLHNLVKCPTHRKIFVPTEYQYSDINRHILMSFILSLRAKHGLKPKLSGDIVAARHIVARINLFSFSQQTLNDLHDEHQGESWLKRYGTFFQWLQENNIIPKTLKIPSIAATASSWGDEIKAKNDKRMPDERALWALGAIRNEIIPTKVPKGIFQRNLKDELIISSATLGLASPQRSAKEQFVLPKSELQSKMVKLDGKEQQVHWINWQGSKGFDANRKHFFRGAALPVTEVLNYWNEAGEPARILCRFFEKPASKLCDLLGDYEPPSLKGFDLNKPIDNMFVLGHLLGFYEGQEQTITITPDSPMARNRPTKQIQDLTLTDRVIYRSQCSALFGSNPFHAATHHTLYKKFTGLNTIKELQEKWIDYIKQSVPSFPMRIIGKKKVKLSNALFIGTGKQLGTVGVSFGYYYLEPVDLASMAARGIKDSSSKTIFQRYNFANDIDLTPYQLRHWSNTMMQNSMDTSDSVIAMVSGRKDIKQNAEYDNRTDDMKMQRVHKLFQKEQTTEEMKKIVRIVGHEEYQNATGKASTITSTGICTQQVAVNPCSYLNDFETHCSLCTSSCHFAHDEKAIQLLKDDLRVQQARLRAIKADEYLHTNKITQTWFIRHHRNTFLLEQLITLMKRDDLKIGTAIKFVNKNNSFRLTDLEKRLTEEVKVLLPDSEKALKQLIAEKQPKPKTDNHDDNKLTNLFTEFGIQGDF